MIVDIGGAQILKRTLPSWRGMPAETTQRITNSLGFKDASPREVAPDGGKTRLMVIGDSFTEGPGLPFDETFAGKLAQGLSPLGIEVLNAGADSYAPADYDRKVRSLIEEQHVRVDHVAVFLDISDIPDEAKLELSDRPTSKVGRALTQNSMLAHVAASTLDWMFDLHREIEGRLAVARTNNISLFKVSRDELSLNALTHLRASEWSYDDKAWADYGERGRARAQADMDRLRAFLNDKGIGMTLVIYPWPDQLAYDRAAPRHRDFWREWAAHNDVAFIDLFDDFTKEDVGETLKRYFMPGDVHWNVAGHALVGAHVLARFLGKTDP